MRTGIPIIRNALKLYWSIPATRCNMAAASGAVTRYPPLNTLPGPHSRATEPGEDSRITFPRHVYQAGSRVGAVMVGCRRNCHARASNSRNATPRISHVVLERQVGLEVESSAVWLDSVSVSAIEATSYWRASGRQGRVSISADGNAAWNTVSFAVAGSTVWPGPADCACVRVMT